jgi:hypothetical protein
MGCSGGWHDPYCTSNGFDVSSAFDGID